ncbi:hypothetical protein HETIRDRAFT_381386 [Heterobasidion irregulare TC 32-1]|uniref:NADP-dependent oxidoreductase domain-containing protein n=1 Tax=Heterobasidion irregulare (strain TC 32-1) TaxID=747525 RepID=W4KFF5_HETIT|nr:uncharacterized protein HETIRDRAFT_381386 [Heterobasidion irregulare TC 32-1]ETW84045.1 hypothetical protein HETIRDRAFT_381386 [Heterobasidion irregulare TC 32-1]
MALTLKSTVAVPFTNFAIPILGLGVFRNDNCKPACLAALAHGYRHIDSARMYRNEKQVGEAVRESGVPREDIFITSKIYQLEGGYQGALSQIDDSLKNFGFGPPYDRALTERRRADYIDLYLIHSPIGGKENRVETWKALLDAKKAGKLRGVGVSNYGPKHIDEIREAGLDLPSVNQVELHPFCQQKEIVDYCNKSGILVEAYCPLVRGSFGDPVLQALCKKYNKDPAQILVRWSLQRGFVPLPKSAKPERVRSNADLYDFEISEEDLAKLNSLDRGKAGAISWNPVDTE